MNKVILNGVDLSIEDVVNVARNGYQVEIDKDCMAHIAEVRNYMESEWMRDDAPAVYGFNTGLGKHQGSQGHDRREPIYISIAPFCPTAAASVIRLPRKWSARPCASV